MDKELRFAAAAALLALGGCSTTSIDVRDTTTFVPSARVSVDLGGEEERPSRLRTSHALELAATAARGGSEQHIDNPGEPVVFGGERFLPPQTLDVDFDFRFASLVYRYRKVFQRSRLGFEARAGLGVAQLAVTVTGATQRASERMRSGGFTGGFAPFLRLGPSTLLELRGLGFWSGSSDDVTSAYGIDLQLAQALGPHAVVRGGWSWWNVRSEREDYFGSSRNSPIHVRFSGPALGLEVLF